MWCVQARLSLRGHGTPKRPEDLSALACVTFDDLTSATTWAFASAGSQTERAVPIHSRLSVNTAEAAIDAAIAGVGVTRVLSYQAAQAVAEGKLQVLLADCETEPLPINLVHVGQGLLPLKTRAFLDFAAPRIRARAAGASIDGTPAKSEQDGTREQRRNNGRRRQ